MMAAAMTMAAACTGVEDESQVDGRQDGPQAIGFGAYLQRGTTRAGAAGTLTLDGATSLQTEGFGVTAYHTGHVGYGPLAQPNFMYNQQVTYDGTNWTYEPVKYWPNETDGLLSFFAYAPYVEVIPQTGLATTDGDVGIGALTSTVKTGDPMARYYVTLTPSECVDLCWAAPQKNLLKPAVGSKVTFNFKHALASLNVQIKTDVDGGASVNSKTRIWVRQVTFDGFEMSGMLNLASENTPTWYDVMGNRTLGGAAVTVYDGRYDGREGLLPSATETPTGLNPQLIQSSVYTTDPSLVTMTSGVTATPQNLFDDEASATAPVLVIPSGAPLTVTIVYDVETYDPLLASNLLSDAHTHGRTIENRITARVTTDGSAPIVLEAGKRYTVNLILGLTSVKTTASIGAWGSGDDGEGDLPHDTSGDETENPVGNIPDYGNSDDDEWKD